MCRRRRRSFYCSMAAVWFVDHDIMVYDVIVDSISRQKPPQYGAIGQHIQRLGAWAFRINSMRSWQHSIFSSIRSVEPIRSARARPRLEKEKPIKKPLDFHFGPRCNDASNISVKSKKKNCIKLSISVFFGEKKSKNPEVFRRKRKISVETR